VRRTQESLRQIASIRASLIRYCVFGLILVAILILVSGRPDWIRAWAYAGFTFLAQVVVAFRLMRVSPELLAERSRMRKGTKTWDKLLAPIVGVIGPLLMWLVAALDVRWHWPPIVSVWWSLAAFGVCAAGFLLTFWAMATNRFFSATVRIQPERGHVVIDGGPYRYLRHPGYTGAAVFTLASPVALGSWLALVPAALVVAVLVLRTALEDRTLRAELNGYRQYALRVPKRLLPGVW
jgi:protein-S-isoprenylcysteine O-methyltransferase Ste14